jgi:hypothetical protein
MSDAQCAGGASTPTRSTPVDAIGIGMATSLSDSHPYLHCKRITRSVQQGRLQRSSLFFVHALQCRQLPSNQLRTTAESFDDEYKNSLPKRGGPFK